MQLRKILEKEIAKSNGQAELVKVPQERRPNTESLKKINRKVERILRKNDRKPGAEIKNIKSRRPHAAFYSIANHFQT